MVTFSHITHDGQLPKYFVFSHIGTSYVRVCDSLADDADAWNMAGLSSGWFQGHDKR